MEIVNGVDLHLIKTNQFKTNHLTFRFSGKRQKETLAQRVLVAQMLTAANEVYPTSRALKEKLASLYGAELSTRLSTKGKVHILDINLSFISSHYSFHQESLLEEMFSLLKTILFEPLISVQQFQTKLFDLEKEHLIQYLEADKEDRFYYSDLELQQLYYLDDDVKYTKYANSDLVKNENSYTAYQEFQRMLKEDKIDIFLTGEYDDYLVLQLVESLGLQSRQLDLDYVYRQPFSSVLREKIEQKTSGQSVLQQAYHFPFRFGDNDYYAFLVFNGLLGAYPHSLLFDSIREKMGLAYSIGSHFDSHTGLLKVYAGIDKRDRKKVLQLINHQVKGIRFGRFHISALEETKKMLINNARLAEDNPYNLMELAYNKSIFGDQCLGLEEWIDRIRQITKEDVMAVAGQVRLQSIYFLEGE